MAIFILSIILFCMGYFIASILGIGDEDDEWNSWAP